jgi:hypothetical protein
MIKYIKNNIVTLCKKNDKRILYKNNNFTKKIKYIQII